jgi:hypothetical protein
MIKVKTSKKGKALMRNKALSAAMAKAIVEGGDKLYSENGIVVKIANGKTITIKGSGVEKKS